MGHLTSLPDGTEEARKVDLHFEAALDFLGSYFRNATIDDIIGAIEAEEDKWPIERVAELRDKLTEIINMNSVPIAASSVPV